MFIYQQVVARGSRRTYRYGVTLERDVSQTNIIGHCFRVQVTAGIRLGRDYFQLSAEQPSRTDMRIVQWLHAHAIARNQEFFLRLASHIAKPNMPFSLGNISGPYSSYRRKRFCIAVRSEPVSLLDQLLA